MSITVLNYLDHNLAEKITNAALARAAAEAAAKETAASSNTDFSTILDATSQSYTNSTSASTYPADLDAIFEEASATYGVPVLLLKAIAKTESNFNPNAVSSAGAVGVMQLMPTTASSLGVTNSYDPYENIMGGAKLMAQLLSKYNGNTVLSLAAYNAGSGNVDKYGGIPPFTETQNYVRKVVAYMNGGFSASTASSTSSSTQDTKSQLIEAIYTALNTKVIPADTSSTDTVVSTEPVSTEPTASATVPDTTVPVTDISTEPVIIEPETDEPVVDEVVTEPTASDDVISTPIDSDSDSSNELAAEESIPNESVTEKSATEESITETPILEEIV